MNPFDPSSLGPLLSGLQRAAEDMKQQAAVTECEGTAGGGLVRVVVTADNQMVSVDIAEQAMEDRELLEDLVRAATAEALRGAKDTMAENMRKLTGGLPLPPGLLPF